MRAYYTCPAPRGNKSPEKRKKYNGEVLPAFISNVPEGDGNEAYQRRPRAMKRYMRR